MAVFILYFLIFNDFSIRNFAPKFKSIAEKTNKARTNFNLDQSESDGTSNDLKLANQTALAEISFGAVDCVHFRTLCDKHNVEAYPTVISFNFGSRNGNHPSFLRLCCISEYSCLSDVYRERGEANGKRRRYL